MHREQAARLVYGEDVWSRTQEYQALLAEDGRWREEECEQLVVHWMEVQPAPIAVLDLLTCNCPKTCSLPRCVCCKWSQVY